MIISKAVGSPYPATGALFAMLPDLLGIWPFYTYKAIEAAKRPKKHFVQNFIRLAANNTFSHRLDAIVYRIPHSFLFAGILSLTLYFLVPEYWVVLTLCYVSHIIIDIPTHQGDFATQYFYPLSHAFYPGKNWAYHPFLALLFWIVLGAAYMFT